MLRRIGTLGGVCIGAYAASLAYRALAPPLPKVRYDEKAAAESVSSSVNATLPPPSSPTSTTTITSAHRAHIFSTISSGYDRSFRFREWYSGTRSQRKLLCKHVRGDVLEVGVGTGMNLTCYQKEDVTSVQAVDSSEQMVEQAKKKYEGMMKEVESVLQQQEKKSEAATAPSITQSFPQSLPPIIFSTQSVESSEGLNFPSHTFHTILSTHTLCSYTDPSLALQEMFRVVKKDGRGRILLLERGKSNQYEWLNRILSYNEPSTLRKTGSNTTRDIDALINTLIQENKLKVVEKRMFNLGTTYLYVIAVPKRKENMKMNEGENKG